jgi:hypothetical protein
MVMQDDLRGIPQKGNALDHAVAIPHVPFDIRPLGVGQSPRFGQDRVADADVPDVVKQRAAPDSLKLRTTQSHGLRDFLGENGDTLGMPLRFVVAVVERKD